MKRLWSLIAALILGAVLAVPVFAAQFDTPNAGFFYHLSGPKELANLIKASLSRNSSGRAKLSEEKCKTERSCATPHDYLLMIRELYLEQGNEEWAPKSVAELVPYLERLVKKPGPPGQYWSSCLKPDGKGGWTPVLRCFARPFKEGEAVWVDPEPGKHKKLTHDVEVFMEDCSNPTPGPKPLVITIIGPFPKDCVYIPFYVAKPMSIVRFGAGGPRTLVSEECIAVRKVGETEFTSGWRNECRTTDCTLTAAFAFLGKQEQLVGSYVADVGWHELRVPRHFAEQGSPFITVLCLEEVGGPVLSFAAFQQQWENYRIQHRSESRVSNGTAIGFQEYRVREERTEARVWYGAQDVLLGQPPLYWHWDRKEVRQRITAAEQQAR